MRQLTYATVCSGIESNSSLREEWREVCGTEQRYCVSNMGRVARTLTRGGKPCFQLLNPIRGSIKYLTVHLSVNGKRKRCTIHRLVALAFLPNPNSLPQINHKDENPLNNHASNLEWCTESYNHNYGTLRDRQIKSHANMICFNGKKYLSIHDCARNTGHTRKTISRKCERISA
jgi:hypothetical protein